RYRGSIAGRRPTGSTPSCSSAGSWGGCVANGGLAARRAYRRMANRHARVPTIAEEDAKRPNRERDGLVGERTRIVNRIKSTLARLGIRNFKPTLRKAAERLATVHPGGHAAAAKHLGRAAARHGAARLCRQPDQGDRAGSSETIGAGD